MRLRKIGSTRRESGPLEDAALMKRIRVRKILSNNPGQDGLSVQWIRPRTHQRIRTGSLNPMIF